MKRHIPVAMLATLLSAAAWGQEVSVYGTTMAEMWKQDIPGADKASFTPATQYLGIDATKLGSDKLSLHLFGWGRTDLGEASSFDGSKSSGYLNYGYLEYRFDQANAVIKAGRFTVNQTTGFEQVDGVSARTDLKGGFTVSAFGGKPVYYKTVDPRNQADYEFQRDFIFGTRLGWRLAKIGEFGVSFLQDGTKAAKDLDVPSPVDYTRKQVGADVMIAPTTNFQFRGRTVWDIASHPDVAPNAASPSRIAEHDYTATMKLGSQVTLTGNFAERNFFAYFAGTNLPSLFRQDDKDMFRGWGGAITWNATDSLQVIGDYGHMHRETYGDVNKVGGDVRWTSSEKKYQAGFGTRFVNAAKTLLVDPAAPGRSLSHTEYRAWSMYSKDRLSVSVDGILQRYDSDNPFLAGLTNVYEVVGSLGFQATTNLKVSGDVSYGSTPASKNETRCLLRADYRFGFARKGGR